MKKADMHTHTRLCGHASGEPEEYLKRAIAAGLDYYGISDHCPWPDGYDSESRMTPAQFPLYRDIVDRMRREAEGTGTKVLYGLEIDWVPGRMDEIEKGLAGEDFDYLIGSIHYVGDFPFDNADTLAEWKRPGRAQEVWDDYVKLMSDFVRYGKFNILGHADLPKKFGYYPEVTPRFIHDFTKIFSEAAKRGIVIEINTSGLFKPAKEAYPSLELLRLAAGAGMKASFGSDSHEPYTLGREFSLAVELARTAGFRSFAAFEKRKPVELPFD